MYESKTYETILSQCLSCVSDTMDTREGSILYDALAPACAQLAILYTELSAMLDRAFPDTATGEDLDRKVAERGLSRQSATCAVRQGTFLDADGAALSVEIGKRFSGGDINFWVSDSDNAYLMAETPGDVGNDAVTTLLPIDYIANLATATLGDVVIPGEDEESDDALRTRYFESMESQNFGGNLSAYRTYTEALDGVGGAKVLRAPSGGGSVGVVIVGSDWAEPSATLVAQVQGDLDPLESQGDGVGMAPIGHSVTVSGAQGVDIAVAFTLSLSDDTTWSNVQSPVEEAIASYFQDLIASWAQSDALVVRISQIETHVLAVAGVVDIADTTLNEESNNLYLDEAEIPILEEVTLLDS